VSVFPQANLSFCYFRPTKKTRLSVIQTGPPKMASRIPNCFENLNGLLGSDGKRWEKGASGAVT
jgi:hypothetical protein